MFVLQGAEEPFDYAVGLRAPHPGTDVSEQRVVAGERLGEGAAAEAWAVVGDHRDRRRRLTNDVVVGVDDVHLAAVGAEVVEVEDPFRLDDGAAQAGKRVGAARRGRDSSREAVLGGVVDQRGTRTAAAARGGAAPVPRSRWTPRSRRRASSRRSCGAPSRPVRCVLGCGRLDRVGLRRRPWAFGWVAGAVPGEPPPVGAFRDPGQCCEPRHRHVMCRS